MVEHESWAGSAIFWLFFGILLGFVSLFVILSVSKSGAEQTKINENLESLNLLQRASVSSNCFIYNKERVKLIGVIDADNFNDERLNICYSVTENNLPAFRITLSSPTAKIDKMIKTRNWNDNRESEEEENPIDIIVYSDNKFHNGEMKVEIQNP